MEQLERYRDWLDPHLIAGSTDLNRLLQAAAPRLFDLVMHAGSGQGVQGAVIGWMIAWWVFIIGGLIFLETRLEDMFCLIVPLAFLLLVLGSLGVVIGVGALRGDWVASLLGEPDLRASSREIAPGAVLDMRFTQYVKREGTLRQGSLRLVRRQSRIGIDSDGSRDVANTDTTIEQVDVPPGGYSGGQHVEVLCAFKIPPGAEPTQIAEKQHNRWFIILDLDFARLPPYQEMYEIIVVSD